MKADIRTSPRCFAPHHARSLFALVVALLGAASAAGAAQDWAARTPFPAPSGPFAVGVGTLHFRDSTRATSRSIRTRPLTVQLWYPAQRGSGAPRAPYVPEPALLHAMVRDGYLDLDSATIRDWSRVRLAARLGARPAFSPSARGWPVLVFSHGMGVAGANYAAMVEELASHGYVVLAIDHPIGGFTLDPNGKLLRPGVDSLHYPARPIISMVRDWAIDDALVLRRAAALLRAPSASPVRLDLDTTRAGVAGHSLGGAAALQACRAPSPFVACADMDGAPFGDVETEGVGKPILVLLSEPDHRRDPPPRDSAESARRRRFLEMGRERDSSWSVICALQRGVRCDVVKLRGTGHFSFSDAPFQFPAQLRGVGATLSPLEMHRAITSRLLDFFGQALGER
jgi:dienelactone hydrolase